MGCLTFDLLAEQFIYVVELYSGCNFSSLNRGKINGLISFSCKICYRVRMHYGHPDVFDRVFHITRGGISKASRVINISEDIYAGK